MLFKAEPLCPNEVTPVLEQGVCLESWDLHCTPGTEVPSHTLICLLPSKPYALPTGSLLLQLQRTARRNRFGIFFLINGGAIRGGECELGACTSLWCADRRLWDGAEP